MDQKIKISGVMGASALFALFDKRIGPVLQSSDRAPVFVLLCEDEVAAVKALDNASFFMACSGLSLDIEYYPLLESYLQSGNYLSSMAQEQQCLSILNRLQKHDENNSKPLLLITSVAAMSQACIPGSALQEHRLHLKVEELYERDDVCLQLGQMGYERVEQVQDRGQFAVRGAIIDIFSPDMDSPRRLEFFDIELESIRSFDINDQTSIKPYESLHIIPCKQVILSDAICKASRSRIKLYCDDLGIPASKRNKLLEALDEKRSSPLYQDLFPLMHEHPGHLWQYIEASNASKHLCMMDSIAIDRQKDIFEDKLQQALRDQDPDRIMSKKTDFFVGMNDHLKKFEKASSVFLEDVLFETADTLNEDNQANNDSETLEQWDINTLTQLKQNLILQRKKPDGLKVLADFLKKSTDQDVYIVAPNAQDQQKIRSLLTPYRIRAVLLSGFNDTAKQREPNAQAYVLVGALSESFCLKKKSNKAVCFIAYSDIFGSKKTYIEKKSKRKDQFSSLKELNKGSYVVHLDHGIGQYQGLQRIALGNVENDFLLLQYAGGDKLYLPVYRLNRIHKYVGGEHAKPSLDKLGGNSTWDTTKQKTKKAVEEMAHKLIALYAKRQLAQGSAFPQADHMYQSFEQNFPFEETPDQRKTIDEINKDLDSIKPMDRLVCGDVGFGKTEIALRAAFRSVMADKQVAVLVPTTILCQQHFETFKKRMEDFPVNVDFMSRFQDKKSQKLILEKLQTGELDIVIGTHRLLSQDIKFKDLGLLVLDEEHRFGVKHKEKVKEYRNQINVLTLTATPIPRTLQLSMTGIRDLSIISTPPLDRKAVKTFLCKNDDVILQQAIRKELAREGQVFVLHNRVQSIETQLLHLKTLVPEARIDYGHGQMDEKTLEKKMLSFINKEFDVLLSTTIIESGLDVPNANTMIIMRADRFGLAQLYQLRGRVGRSSREAFTYLMIPGESVISTDAMKRLKALQRFTDLGSGLKIAMYDLEIRGAGNLLGAQQSGHISDVGFELYTQLLEREVRRLKGEAVKEELEPEIQTALPAFFPEDYVKDTQERLNLYKRFSAANSEDELRQLMDEVRDRFGPIPNTVKNLAEVIDMKIIAKQCGVAILRLNVDKASVEFSDQAHINVDVLLKMVKRDDRVQMSPDQKISLTLDPDLDAFAETKAILLKLKAA